MQRSIWSHLMRRSHVFMNQIAFYDPDHSDEEDREIMIAKSNRHRVLLTCYTIRGEKIRVISARLATKQEIKDYESGI